MDTKTLEEFAVESGNGRYGVYSQYKSTGVDWFKSIPEHWSIVKLGYCLERNQSGVWGDEPEVEQNGVEVLRSTEQESDGTLKINNPAIRDLSEDEYEDTKLESGDLIITTSSGSKEHIGKTSLVTDDIENRGCSFSNFMQRLTPKPSLNSPFISYLLNSPVCREQFKYLQSSTTGLGNINSDTINNLTIPKPPKEEQEVIVEFLGRELTKIGELLELKERLIKLVREQEEAIITEMTTSGMNNPVSTQEAKDETVSELPIDWDESTLGKITKKLTNGYVGPTRDILRDDGVPYIQSMHIKNGEIEFNDEFFVSKEWSKDHPKSRLREGDVLIVQTGVDTGESAIVREGLDGSNCHALIIARPVEEVNSRYLNLFLGSRMGKNLLESIQTGATVQHLNTTRVKDVTIPLPPEDEQKDIADYLESKREEFDSTVDLINQGIERLKEYRTALITEAVTGQIDVRGEV